MDEEDAVGISRSCPDLSSCREMRCPAAAVIGSRASFADGPLRQREDEGKERRAQESSTVAFPPCSQIGATRGVSPDRGRPPLLDDQGDFSSVSMDTAVAIRTLEATYKSSAEAAAVESMIAKLIDKTYAVQGLVQNEYVSTSFAVGATRTIPGVQAVRGLYGISSSTGAKWMNLLVLFLMAIGYWVVLYVLLRLDVRRHVRLGRCSCWPSIHTIAAPK
ncbi:uncharacterized protein [Aegilops tauschii subsp. strangulata]|uniref:uncharacterized protein n=1 Tax=Aegilops tauschii subsp. strangulata TaxID=200361 RepID=UPI003CC87036